MYDRHLIERLDSLAVRHSSRRFENPTLSRRQLLILLGAAGAACLLPGCGGGGGIGGHVDDLDSARKIPTGPLADQVNMYSGAVESLSSTWTGSSETMTAGKAFLDANPEHMHDLGRAEGDYAAKMYHATYFGHAVALESYERVLNQFIGLDDIGVIGKIITDQNGLINESSLENPQWVAAMLERSFNALVVFETILKVFQTMGLAQWMDMVRATTDPDERLVAYDLVATMFNQWVDGVAKAHGLTANPAHKLDVSSAVTAESALTEINRIPDIVDAMPLGPGYRPAESAISRSSGSSGGDLAAGAGKSFGMTFLAYMAHEFAHVTEHGAKVNSVGVVKHMAGSAIKHTAGSRLDTLAVNFISAGLEQGIGGQGGKAAYCAVQIAHHTYRTAQYTSYAIGASGTVVGAVVLGGVATYYAYKTFSTIAECKDELSDRHSRGRENNFKRLDDGYRPDGGFPPGRDVPAPTGSQTECDQLANNGLGEGDLDPTGGSGGGPGDPDYRSFEPDPVRRLFCAAFNGSTRGPDLPRTFTNLRLGAAALIFDFVKGYPILNAQATPTRLRFIKSDFAILLRREPNTQSIVLPAITSAQLLCSAPGFIPHRNKEPMNLATIDKLPEDHITLDQLGAGVKINVS